MSHYSRLLIHTCTRQRVSTSQSDDNELYRDWDNAGTATLSCRYMARQERYADEDMSGEVRTDTKLYAEIGADITTEDRVIDVLAADGSTIEAGPFDVIEVLPKYGEGPHHTEIRLEKVE